MKRLLAVLAALNLAASNGFAAQELAAVLWDRYPAAERKSIQAHAPLLGLSFSPEGQVLMARENPATGKFEVAPLEEEQAKQVLLFLSRLGEDPEIGMSLALQSYMASRMTPEEFENSPFLKKDSKGRFVLTAMGKNALMDILTAADGQLLEPLPSQRNTPFVWAGADAGQAGQPGGLQAVNRHQAAAAAPTAAFDGTRHTLGSFDWAGLDEAVTQPGGLHSAGAPAEFNGYAIDHEAGSVRVLVAGGRVGQDRFRVSGEGADAAVYGNAGLDEEVFRRHGATVVRSVDNIVTVDVPLPMAAALGLELQQQGIESRPARIFRSSRAAAVDALSGATGALLGGQFLPLPTAEVKFSPLLADSSVSIDADALHRQGMRGRGSVVGIIDSGIDENHPDFRDADGNTRITEYADFTQEGNDDVVGHGTHVAGIVGGTGKESDGQYQGTAPETTFKVAKVFGTEGETDESVILAAMKWMRTGTRIDVLNMSLGGPGAPNHDPLSSMANHMTVNDNILVVAAAGNEGPWDESVGSPGNARYALTIGGVDKEGSPVFFSSRGPIRDEHGNVLYAKPDMLAVAGGVDFSSVEGQMVDGEGASPRPAPGSGTASLGTSPAGATCVYAPGVISTRSSADTDSLCTVEGRPGYRYMSGTSQATPMAAGFAADVIGFVRELTGEAPNAFAVKAALMETSVDLEAARETQGSGLMNGGNVARAVTDRVKRGIPIGNIAYMLAMRMTSDDLRKLDEQSRYELTPLGVLDTQTGHLLSNEAQIERALMEIRRPLPPLVVRRDEAELPRA